MISVSTPQILRQINYEKLQHLNNEALLTNLKKEDWQEATKYMGNVLEPLTMKFYPEIGRLKNKMKELGADVAQMSGTGPTVFAICHTESRAKRIDRFYNDELDMEKLRDYGILGTEMESAGLYLLAAKLHFRALSVLTVSDLIFGDEKATAEERERTFNDMINISLETAIAGK